MVTYIYDHITDRQFAVAFLLIKIHWCADMFCRA